MQTDPLTKTVRRNRGKETRRIVTKAEDGLVTGVRGNKDTRESIIKKRENGARPCDKRKDN